MNRRDRQPMARIERESAGGWREGRRERARCAGVSSHQRVALLLDGLGHLGGLDRASGGDQLSLGSRLRVWGYNEGVVSS